MSLTAAQITETSLAAEISYAAAETRIGLLNEAQEDKLSDLLDEWEPVKRKYSDLTGKIAGYTTDNEKKRAAIKIDICTLLGLTSVSHSQSGGAIGSSNGRTAVDF